MTFELSYFFNYYLILYYIIFSLFISLILVVVSVLLRYLSATKPDFELTAAYECGFLPFDRVRNKFEVKFFMIALLFVISDLEVIFILPWSLCLSFFSLVQFM